jgi:REP element-mobilizing transposase RayT
MARQNRSEIFDPNEVSVMHCINRAVRRAMLCGFDKFSGESYVHRRDWIKNRLIFLAKFYGIDVLGYAIMGNHLHCILRNRPDIVATWSDEEIARRIWFLFPKRKEEDGTPCEPTEFELNMLMASSKLVEQYRSRLSDISWLMRQLAEHVAVKANKEDECTGRFWEGRFKSQLLLDEVAILACSAYVDLNPVRAAIAETPEESDYTSVQDRIESAKKTARSKAKTAKQRQEVAANLPDRWLSPVYLNERKAPGPMVMVNGLGFRASDKGFLPIKLVDYLSLVDWTGRQIANGKRGRIPDKCKPILERLGLSREIWCDLVKDFGRLFGRVAGRPGSLEQSAESSGISNRRSHGGAAMLAT